MWKMMVCRLTRRLVVGAVLLACGPAAADVAPIRIMVLGGQDADLVAVRMAVDQAGGSVAGRPVTVGAVRGDGDPGGSARLADRVFEPDADLVIVAGESPATLSVIARAKTRRRLVMATGALAPDLTRAECNKYLYRYGPDLVALASVLGQGLSTEPDGRRWVALVEDTEFARAAVRAFVPEILARHGEILKRVPISPGTADLGPVVSELQSLRPGVIGVFGDGPAAMDAIAQAEAADLPAFVTAATLQAFDLDRPPGAFAGVRGVVAWVWSQNPASRAWAERFAHAAGGVWPGPVQAADYSAASQWLEAARATGGTDPDAIVDYLDDRPIADMFAGGGRLRARDHALAQDLFLVEVASAQAAAGPHAMLRVLGRVPAGQAFPAGSAEGCHKVW